MTENVPVVTGTTDERVPFVLDLAVALHEAGYATYHTEEALAALAGSLGLPGGQYFVTPTSIFASFEDPPAQRTYMLRTEPKPPNLGQLVEVTETARAVLHRKLTPALGSDRLAEIRSVPPPAAGPLIAAHGLASAVAARFLGGAWAEIRMAALAGIVTGILAAIAIKLPNVRRVYELMAAFVCSFTMAALAVPIGGYSVSIATLAGLIVLVPGLTLTTAIGELAMSHLQAGTSRLSSAFMTFIGIGFGVALGSQVAAALVGTAEVVTPVPMPAIANWIGLVASAVAFSILLRADRRDLGWIIMSGALAFTATRLGSYLVGPELGAFIGALAVGLGSNLFNRITRRPASVTMVPGLLTLVPGSVGFRSIFALLDSQIVTGIDTAFTMILTAVALVAGLLTASAIYPEKRIV